MVNDIFKSFFRTIGRILAYIVVALIIAYITGYLKPVSATVYSGEPIALEVGGYMIPEYFGVSANSETKYAMTLYVEDYSVYNGSRFALATICTPYDVDNWYITNSGKVNSYFDEFFDTYDTGKRCYMGNNVRGTLRLLQFYIGKPKTIEGTNEIRVSSYLHIKNIYAENARYDFLQVQLSDEDYLAPLINQSVSTQKQQEIVDKLTENIQGLNDIKTSQDTTNDTLNSEDEDTTSKKCGVVCKLKGIFTGIIELPKKIINLMIDALKSLFIPSDTEFITNFVDSIENKLGFIAEIPIRVIQFGLNLVNASWTAVTSLNFPSVSIMGYYFWEAKEIDITPAINIFKPYKYLTDIACVCLCVATLNRWREKFTGGGS